MATKSTETPEMTKYKRAVKKAQKLLGKLSQDEVDFWTVVRAIDRSDSLINLLPGMANNPEVVEGLRLRAQLTPAEDAGIAVRQAARNKEQAKDLAAAREAKFRNRNY